MAGPGSARVPSATRPACCRTCTTGPACNARPMREPSSLPADNCRMPADLPGGEGPEGACRSPHRMSSRSPCIDAAADHGPCRGKPHPACRDGGSRTPRAPGRNRFGFPAPGRAGPINPREPLPIPLVIHCRLRFHKRTCHERMRFADRALGNDREHALSTNTRYRQSEHQARPRPHHLGTP